LLLAEDWRKTNPYGSVSHRLLLLEEEKEIASSCVASRRVVAASFKSELLTNVMQTRDWGRNISSSYGPSWKRHQVEKKVEEKKDRRKFWGRQRKSQSRGGKRDRGAEVNSAFQENMKRGKKVEKICIQDNISPINYFRCKK
jgi:hypothetical protein